MKKQTKLGLVLAAAAVISVSVASLVSARGWVQQGADWYYVDNNGDYVTGTIQSSGNAKFYLDEETGAMQRDYLLQDYNGNTYYFGSNGAMVTNTWVAVDSSIVDSGADYIPDNFWFYFQASGKAVKGSDTLKKTTIDGKKYAFSDEGTMLTGWIADSKTVNPDDESNPFIDAAYYAGGDNDGVLRSGWVTYYDGYDGDDSPAKNYTNLYFYFNPTNNTKTTGTKKINGRTYAFDSDGVMLSGWDAAAESIGTLKQNHAYFSGEDDGHQVKKGWVYASPTEDIDQQASSDYDDEEKYMYFNAAGDIVANQMKKINGKYYVFGVGEEDADDYLTIGTMKTGLVVWAPGGAGDEPDRKFITTFDLDWANGSDLAKKGIVRYGADSAATFEVNADGTVIDASTVGKLKAGDVVKFYNFADDGSRKDGSNTITFADDEYTFVTNAAGNKPSGSSAKKYYSLGIQLKASSDIKYGIYATDLETTGDGALKAQSATGTLDAADPYVTSCVGGKYYVLNTSGSKVKGKDQAYKDTDGNYWLIDKAGGTLKGIWTVNIKKTSAAFTTIALPATGSTAITDEDKLLSNTDLKDIAGMPTLWDSSFETEYSTLKWKRNKGEIVNNKSYCKYTSQKIINQYWFQSDYGDKANVWIPFGFYDIAGKTCVMNLSDALSDAKTSAYLVTPTNDYFLNCYWAD